MSEIKKVKRKKGFKPVGIFLFGVLFGFLFTLTAIIGTGFWVYKNLTLNKIEKITKNEIDIGNESIKNLTIEDVVKNISGVVQNLDTYTIEQIEDDFNIVIVGEGGFIKEEMYGLDMTPLKKATKNTIKDVFQDIIGTASMQTVIENLGSNQDMGMFSTILDTEIEYYYNSVDKKLYAEYCSSPGFPVHHQLPELTQTHVHQVSDAIQLSHPLPSPFPPIFNLSQHQGLF